MLGAEFAIYLGHLVDWSPICVTDTTPFDCVLEMFDALGARQICVTRNGDLVGLITRKDALNYDIGQLHAVTSYHA